LALGILGYTLFSLITYTGDIERLVSDVKINGVGLGLAFLAAVLTGQT
jgi:polyferredoxin